jgi:glucose-6-phosphate-specific signal transduction histidine kinase
MYVVQQFTFHYLFFVSTTTKICLWTIATGAVRQGQFDRGMFDSAVRQGQFQNQKEES